MSLRVHRLESAPAFLEEAGSFLAEHEAENNLVFGICSSLEASPGLYSDATPQFLTVVDDRGAVRGASLRTPPHNQVLAWTDAPEAIDALVDALAAEQLPGVLGPTHLAARFATRWAAQRGSTARRRVAERIFRLTRVIPPARPPSGAWRILGAGDRDLLAAWMVAFRDEAAPEAPAISDPPALADRWVAQEGRIGYVWEDDDRVVSFAGSSGATPNGMRIGPVYTPPEDRGRGYASALTAAASQHQLDRGRRFTFLFTDLSNPTSNKIYQAIGYEPVCDVDDYGFADA
ncbi:MAG: GNAT family N-acetyltransferase [Chloroflexi bacterium]|nr:GNAT family N-acetyltransferase [Chloroflexota bacterium]